METGVQETINGPIAIDMLRYDLRQYQVWSGSTRTVGPRLH
jgi:hypothetical protein